LRYISRLFQNNNGLHTKIMKNPQTLAMLASLAFFAVFPLLFPNPAVTGVAVLVLIFAGAATGWNIFSGYTGYISLGHAAFYGIGAYILALMCQIWNIPGGIVPLLLLPIVGLLTGLCSLFLGWIALKTRRFTFLVITIAIFSVASQLPNFLTAFISSIGMLTLPIPPWNGYIYNVPFYYIALLLLLFAFCLSWWIRHSRYGLSLLAIRDDEGRAEGLGLRVGLLKLSAFMISASFVGTAGAITVYFTGFIAPTSAFDRSLNIAIPLIVFVGGTGTVWGPILGAIIVVSLQQYLTLQFGSQDWDLILYGALLLVIMLTLPEGILPTLSRRWAARQSAWSVSNPEETWDKTDGVEAASSIPRQLPTTPMWDIASPILQQMIADDVAQIQPPEPPAALIPRRHVELPAGKGLTQKVRAHRLVSLPTEAAGKPSAFSGPVTPLPLVGWPCPRCNEPLLAWGDMHFCKRCGLKLTRSHK